MLSWIQQEEELSEGALTVVAQQLPADDDGNLAWPTFMPRVDVDTTRVNEIDQIDDRPVADRRAWDTRGRLVPIKTADTRVIEFTPIEARDTIREQEINRLSLEVRGNQDIFRSVIGARIPDRVNRLALANLRRVELDCFMAWSLGYVNQTDPETGRSTPISFNFDSGRYQTAGTAWSDGSLNAYDELIAWMTEGVDEIGAAAGVMLRRATLNAVLADAPDLAGGAAMTRSQLEQRITDDMGFEFRFFVNEKSLDIFNDGGTARTRTKVWAAEKVALVPDGLRAGSTAFAPVARAQDLVNEFGDAAGIDVRGNTLYYDKDNGGRGLSFEVQLNAFTIPAESKMWQIDAGV